MSEGNSHIKDARERLTRLIEGRGRVLDGVPENSIDALAQSGVLRELDEKIRMARHDLECALKFLGDEEA